MAQIIELSNHALNLASATNEYKKNVIQVCNYISAVAVSNLPVLKHPFADWEAFSKTFVQAKTDVQIWTNDVVANLLATPRVILDVNKTVHAYFSDAVKDADFLIEHPKDEPTIQLLSARLKRLIGVVSGSKSDVDILLEKVKSFASDLPKQAGKLESIADEASKEEKVDQQKIKELQADIKRLNDDIASLTAQIVALGIADAACITLGVVAVAVAGPWGLVTWPFLGAGLVVATTFIILDGIKIHNDQEQIKADQTQINEYTQDAAQLKAFANTFKNLADQALAIQANLKQITDEWTKLEKSIQTVIEDLAKAGSGMKPEDWKYVKTAFETGAADWDKMIKLVGPLNIQINANDAQIKPGMSESEVKEAVKKGNNMGFVEFIRRAG